MAFCQRFSDGVFSFIFVCVWCSNIAAIAVRSRIIFDVRTSTASSRAFIVGGDVG